ncbi:MAG TPA: Ppx/GppA phosphatase family protein [Verrucomicrobiae bacterium]|nr:Ppx/GppA phosphatase family protein [Verrucomicrobiae bacterium]
MSSPRRAVIDVGTNSIKLLVAEVVRGQVTPVLEESRQTRLGKGFYPAHVLQQGPINESALAIAEFARRAADLGVEHPRVVATSAMREAYNRDALVAAVEQSCALPIRIISGEEEADYAFRGVTSDPRFKSDPLVILDVGGGSTEFILGQGERKHFAMSFKIGTVRLLEQAHPSDPPTVEQLATCRKTVREFLEKEVGPSLKSALARESGPGRAVQLVGTGGTASVLGCLECRLTAFDRERLESTPLGRDRVSWHAERLWSMPLDQRRNIPGLPSNRADVILTGTAIFEGIMACFDFNQLRISTRGLRFAVVLED